MRVRYGRMLANRLFPAVAQVRLARPATNALVCPAELPAVAQVFLARPAPNALVCPAELPAVAQVRLARPATNACNDGEIHNGKPDATVSRIVLGYL